VPCGAEAHDGGPAHPHADRLPGVDVLQQLRDVLGPHGRPDLELQDRAVRHLHVDAADVHLPVYKVVGGAAHRPSSMPYVRKIHKATEVELKRPACSGRASKRIQGLPPVAPAIQKPVFFVVAKQGGVSPALGGLLSSRWEFDCAGNSASEPIIEHRQPAKPKDKVCKNAEEQSFEDYFKSQALEDKLRRAVPKAERKAFLDLKNISKESFEVYLKRQSLKMKIAIKKWIELDQVKYPKWLCKLVKKHCPDNHKTYDEGGKIAAYTSQVHATRVWDMGFMLEMYSSEKTKAEGIYNELVRAKATRSKSTRTTAAPSRKRWFRKDAAANYVFKRGRVVPRCPPKRKSFVKFHGNAVPSARFVF